MKVVTLQLRLLLILISLLFSACGSDSQAFRHESLAQIHQQLTLSCQASGAMYHKTVRDLLDPQAAAQDSAFVLADSCQLLSDLAFLLEQSSLEATIVGEYKQEKRGDTLLATVLPGREKRVDVQRQAWVFSSVDSTLLFVELTIRKRQFLYDLDAEVAVTFDSTGRYLAHQQKVKIDISGGVTYHAATAGEAKYP